MLKKIIKYGRAVVSFQLYQRFFRSFKFQRNKKRFLIFALLVCLGVMNFHKLKIFQEPKCNFYKNFCPQNERQQEVVRAFKHGWAGYKSYAWGFDNLLPISKVGTNWFGLGLNIVDSLDTLWIMNLTEEYKEARNWVATSLNLAVGDVSLFEVTIRVLGGLLSIYHLTGDKLYLNKSIELGDRLLPCFNTPYGVPGGIANLGYRAGSSYEIATSEAATIQLEFNELSRISGNQSYGRATYKLSERIHLEPKFDGLVPGSLNTMSGSFSPSAYTLGGGVDSYYEYLLKQWIQLGMKNDSFLIADYKEAVEGIRKHLRKIDSKGKPYFGELTAAKNFRGSFGHLTCFLPATLILGHFVGGMPESHYELAKEVLNVCFEMYASQPTFLSPEEVLISHDDYRVLHKSNHLRPEFIESLYYFYAFTGNKTYQDMGWIIFESFEKYAKVPNGYTTINDVTREEPSHGDFLETFFFAETLKYFFLLFDDNPKLVDLTKYLFNTEAHFIPVQNKL